MMGMNFTRFLLLGLVLTSSAFAAGWPSSGQRQSVKIFQTTEPIHPRDLLQYGVTSGYATFLINVSEEGKLEDWLVTAYSHKEFADTSLAALREWRYEPARIDGRPIGVITEVRFVFEAGRVLVQMSSSDLLTALMYQTHRASGYEIGGLAELDRIPVPQVVQSPAYPEEYAKKGIVGEALVEFIIDETGKVRMPSVVRADYEELAQLANHAVKDWQFEAPLKKGHPVAVRAQQLFKFQPKASPATAR